MGPETKVQQRRPAPSWDSRASLEKQLNLIYPTKTALIWLTLIMRLCLFGK